MNGRALVAAVLLLGVAGYCYFHQVRVSDSVFFEGREFSLEKEQGNSNAKNFYYMPEGTSVATAKEFIQVVHVGAELAPDLIDSAWGQISGHYALEESSDHDLYLGEIEKQGFKLRTFAVKTVRETNPLWIIYVREKASSGTPQSSSEQRAIFDALVGVVEQL